MKKLLLSRLLLLTCISMASPAQAADTYVEIGSASQESTHFPMAVNWRYNMTQQIYTIEEIGRGGIINSVSFRLATSASRTRSIDLYLVNVAKTYFESKTDWINVTDDDKVFSGDVTFPAGDWRAITLDKAFDYNGYNNLAVIVHDRTGQDINYYTSFQSFDTESQQGIYAYNDDAAYNPADMNGKVTARGLDKQKNRIRLGFDSGIVQIGNGTNTTAMHLRLPIGSRCKYSLSQQIYTKEEIGRSGSIQGIAFFYEGNEAMSRKINLYIQGIADKSNFTVGDDFVRSSQASLVYSGNIYAKAYGGWYFITFNRPFKYSGEENILVTVEDFSGYNDMSIYHLALNANNQAIFDYSNDTPYDITGDMSSVSGTVDHNYKNTIRLRIEEPDTPIDKIEISGLTAPQYGEHPSYDITVPDGAPYFPTYISWVRNWEPSSSLDIVGGDKTFNSTTDAYTGLIWVRASEGYEITEETNVLINGRSDLVAELSYNGDWCVRTKPFYVTMPYSGGVIDFSTAGMSQFPFENDSEHPWFVTTREVSVNGTDYCMMSGNAGYASSSSAISATHTYDGDGYVCFDAKCMGEGSGSGWDKCIFYIDGDGQFSYGALGNFWNTFSFPVAAGEHTFKWEYTKDSSVDPDGDAFFVDNIMFLEKGKDDDKITGMASIGGTDEEGTYIYNVAGQRLAKKQKGINIIAGKKALVR